MDGDAAAGVVLAKPSAFARLARRGAQAARLLALVLLLAWTAGWVWTDATIWTQMLWWGGVPVLILAGVVLGLGAIAGWVAIPAEEHASSTKLQRWSRRVPILLLALACAGEGWHQFNGRALLASRQPNPADALLIVHWNYSGGGMKNPRAMADALVSTGQPDVILISMQNYHDQRDAIRKAMGEGPAVKIEMIKAGIFTVFSRVPIKSVRQFVVPMDEAVGAQSPGWFDRGINALIRASGIYPRDAENIAPGYITAVELATTPRLGRPTTIYFIDYPSSPLLHRARVAELVRRKINQITMPPLGESAVPMPDVVIGDFNTPRSSASLLRLLPGFWPASDHAGLGLLKTFPRPRCLLHIDNTLVSPTWYADEYGIIDPGISEHKAQRVRLWPKN